MDIHNFDLLARLRAGLSDRYAVEIVGRVKMATVYLAHDIRRDRPVARGVDHEMAVGVYSRLELDRLAKPLYAKRLHPGSTTEPRMLRAIRFWWLRHRVCRRLRSEPGGRLLGCGAARMHLLLPLGLLLAARTPFESAGVGRTAVPGARVP